jgi:hypothetical protein
VDLLHERPGGSVLVNRHHAAKGPANAGSAGQKRDARPDSTSVWMNRDQRDHGKENPWITLRTQILRRKKRCFASDFIQHLLQIDISEQGPPHIIQRKCAWFENLCRTCEFLY